MKESFGAEDKPQSKEELFQLRELELVSCKIENSLKSLPAPRGITPSRSLGLSLFKAALQPFLLSLKERIKNTARKAPGYYSPRPFKPPRTATPRKVPSDFFVSLFSERPPRPPSSKKRSFMSALGYIPLSEREKKVLLATPTAVKINGVMKTIRQASTPS